VASERGSILPIGLAGIAVSLMVSLVFLELVGVQLQTLRNKQVADVLSLKVSADLLHDGISPIVGLEYLPATQMVFGVAIEHLKIRPSHASVVSFDGKTIEATVCSYWLSISGITLGNSGEVCAKSKARAIS
jgi:hypothetical protein